MRVRQCVCVRLSPPSPPPALSIYVSASLSVLVCICSSLRRCILSNLPVNSCCVQSRCIFCAHSGPHRLSGLHDLFAEDKDTGEKVMTHTKLRHAIAALGGVHPSCVPRGDVHDLLEKYDKNFNGLDMTEFTVSCAGMEGWLESSRRSLWGRGFRV